jgi:hypothetical protein
LRGGKVVAQTTLKTSGAPKKLKLTAQQCRGKRAYKDSIVNFFTENIPSCENRKAIGM